MHPATRLQIQSVSRHWNSDPNHVYHRVKFRWTHAGMVRTLQAIVFHDPGQLAVFGDGPEDWVGSYFEEQLRHEIAAWEEKRAE